MTIWKTNSNVCTFCLHFSQCDMKNRKFRYHFRPFTKKAFTRGSAAINFLLYEIDFLFRIFDPHAIFPKNDAKKKILHVIQFDIQNLIQSKTINPVITPKKAQKMAERVGFEPTVELPLHSISNAAPSTTRPSLRLKVWLIYHGI